jgi:hypothetical protein
MKRMKTKLQWARAIVLLLAAFITATVWADDTFTYASGSTWTDNRPVHAQYKYSLSQQIYTPAQLGDVPFKIKSIGFYNSVSTEVTRTLKIYMVETEKIAFDAGIDWVVVTDANLVFSGDVVFAAGDWNTINLSNPFAYTATKNVVLVVNDVTGEQVASNYPKCRVNTGLTNFQSKYAMSNDAVYDATNLSEVNGYDRYRSVNQLRLIVDAPAKPTSPSVTNQTAYTAPATWNGEADSWNLQYKLYDGTTWTAVNGLTTASYIIEGLDPETRYIFRVQAVVDGKPSLWATSSSFYTTASIPKPTGVSCTAFTTTTATLGWKENGSATQWQICLDGDEANLINTTNNSYVVTNLTLGVKHSAKIRAISGSDYSGWSQTTAVEATSNTVIGSGSVFEGEGIPIHHGTKCAITEEIYTCAELGSSPKTIKSIGFYVPRAYDNGSRNVDIYMVSTAETSFTQFGWIHPTTGDLVFSGTVNFKPTGWINITLSTPFEYDGKSNVAIIVDDNTGSLNTLYFSVYSSTSSVTIHRAEDTNRDPADINYNGTLYDYKNLICLEMADPVDHAPINIGVIPQHITATISWTGYSDSYSLRYKATGDTDWQPAIAANVTSATLSGLTAETNYVCQVQGISGESSSDWSEQVEFATLPADTKIFIADGNWNVAANWEPTGIPTLTDDVVIQAAAIIPSGVVATARYITIEGDDGGGGGEMAPRRHMARRAPAAVSSPSITIKDGGQLRHSTQNLLVTLEKNITGYGNSTTDGYYLLALPSNDFCWPEDVGMTSGNYDLYSFDEDKELEWRNYKAENFTLFPNNEEAYLYANSSDQTLSFTGRVDGYRDGFHSIVVVDDDAAITQFANGWRVFGNNAVCNAYVDYGTYDSNDNFVSVAANFYKMNAAGNGFNLYKNRVVVAPGEAVFMEVRQSGRLRCSYEPFANAPTAEEGTYNMPWLPQHGLTAHQDAHVVLADASDNTNLITTLNGKTVSVVLNGRTLYRDGYWNTLTLPFNLTLADSPLAGATARPLSKGSITGTTLNLTFDNAVAELVAGTPYIIMWAEPNTNIVNPVFSGVTVSSATNNYDSGADDGDLRVRFLGTYKSTEFTTTDQSILFIGAENNLYYPEPSGGQNPVIGACRAYFKIGDGTALARQLTAFNIDFGDETNGIENVQRSGFNVQSESWFTLDGRKLNGKPARAGVYINNGRKVVIK